MAGTGRARATTLARRLLRAGASRPAVRRALGTAARELDRAVRDAPFGEDVYGAGYYGDGRDPDDRGGLSGYERYDRDTSNADVAAYLLWRHFGVHRVLDVGCATGFVVEALRELGLDAKGVDVSRWAVQHPALGATGHIGYGDLLERLPFEDDSFDLVSAFETLEHLPPESVPRALLELRRVTRSYVVATIPSFGRNEHGPGGWYQQKVREELLPRYWARGEGYDGPVPFDDIARDATGAPLEGHLTMASFRWWTERFACAGFVRLGEVERAIHPHLARFGLTKYWNLYVFALPSAAVPDGPVRDEAALAERERLWKLDVRTADPEDEDRVREALTSPGGGPLTGVGEIPPDL
ncbi:MAG: class I SAM-dependent methyltransferase [Acidimicrobiales bacterium]